MNIVKAKALETFCRNFFDKDDKNTLIFDKILGIVHKHQKLEKTKAQVVMDVVEDIDKFENFAMTENMKLFCIYAAIVLLNE